MLPAIIHAPGARSRDFAEATFVRLRRATWRVTPLAEADLALRVAAPAAFAVVRGVITDQGRSWLIEQPARGRRVARLARDAVPFSALALLAWRLAAAGAPPRELDLAGILLHQGEPTLLAAPVTGTEGQCAQSLTLVGAHLGGRRPTAALRAPRLADVVSRALGGAANLLLRSALVPLPDAGTFHTWCADALAACREGGLPVVLPAPDAETAAALLALLARVAMAAGTSLLPEGMNAPGAVRLLHGIGAADIEPQLARQRGPTLCVLQAEPAEARAALAHAAQILDWPAAGRAALAAWLRPLHTAPELVNELLLPLIERDAFGARRLVGALIERAGARVADGAPQLDPGWPAELAAMTASRRVDVVHPGAARLALLLHLSHPGLDAAAVEASAELRRGAELLAATGLATRGQGVLAALPSLPAPAASAGARRAACLWLAEREHLCPFPDPLRRAGWAAALRLRHGDLGAWQDCGCADLFTRLWQARHFDDALALCEAHAACAARFGAGPPEVQVQIAARDLALAQWNPRRARRLLRLWLRGYHGPWRAHLLGLMALIERQLSGPEAYAPLVHQVRRLAPGLPRLEREQALLAAAHACCFEEPDNALELLAGLADQPAQAQKLCVPARVLFVRAECSFIAIRSNEALALAQQARQALPERGYGPIRARWEAEIESLLVMTHGMVTFFARPAEEVSAPLVELERRHGGCRDILARTLVNQHLFRLRMREIGSLSAADSEAVLAEARPDNLRGYMIVLYQLSENAAYGGDGELVRRLGARLHALHAPQVSPMAWCGWARHEAMRLALAGDFAGAARLWRQGGVARLSEPWRTRMGNLQRGERGVLRIMAGKWRAGLADLLEASRRLIAMSAGARASGFFSIALAARLVLGQTPPEEEIRDMESLGRKGFAMPRLSGLLARAVAARSWDTLREEVEAADCPPLWKCFFLGAGALCARALGARQAATLARAGAALAPSTAPLLRLWLEREFPAQRPDSVDLPMPVLAALARLHVDPLRPPPPDEVVRQVLDALGGVTGRNAAALVGGVLHGDAALADACQQARLEGEHELQGVIAASLASSGGALALASGPQAWPVLRAFAARLDELLWICGAQQDRDQARRAGRTLAAAAWAIATEESFASRLSALSQLCAAETGQDAVELALLRRGKPVLAGARVADAAHEVTRRVDDVLALRLRARGGTREAAERACSDAARALANALRQAPEHLRNELGRAEQGEVVYAAGEPLGTSPAAARLATDIRRFADLELAVTITGPVGSGKDLAARALHQSSARGTAPLVVVDSATLRVETAASELFGHVRGAFTGATTDHAGLLESAGNGTLLLDNPGELAPSVQAMLLRALQQRRFLPVGGTSERAFQARVVVTSAATLDELVDAGKLRPDLAQRLAGLNLRVPALAERGDDALFLARHFARQVGVQFGRKLRLGPAAERAVAEHPWPGNVRQLRTSIVRAAALCAGGLITPEDLAEETGPGTGGALRLPRDVPGLSTGGRLVLAGLRELGETGAAELVRRLGLSRTTVSTALAELARRGLASRQGRARATRYAAMG